jgi:hypothetical protein
MLSKPMRIDRIRGPEGPAVSWPGLESGNAIAENMSAKGAALAGAIVPRFSARCSIFPIPWPDVRGYLIPALRA